MWVTIIADASFCHETGAAGYGFWIASQRGKKGGDGPMKDPVANNIAAEMMALLNAMVSGRKSGLILKFDNILLQTDCQAAIDAFNGIRKSISKQEESLVDWFNSFVAEQELFIKFKHVKGHTNNSESRFVVNRMCDHKARQHMRKARGHLRIKALKVLL